MAKSWLIPDLAAEERLRFRWTAVGFMCVAGAALLSRTAGDALFLSRYAPDRIPYMYVGSAVVVMLATYLYSLGSGRIAVGRLTAGAAGLLVLLNLTLRFLLALPWGGFRVAAYFLADLTVNLPMLLFWGFAALVFDLREGKRLFGLIGACGTTACILAGFVVRPYATRFGTENILFLVCLLLTGFGATVLFLSRHEAARLRPPGRPRSGSQGTRFGYYGRLVRMPQVLGLTLLVLITTLSLFMVDFQFKTAVRMFYREAGLASFFGTFYGFGNIVALVVQLFLVHRILRHGGLLASLAVFPVALFVASAGTSVVASQFPWVVGSKALDPVLNFTINSAAMQMLYLGIQPQTRGQARAFVEGFCKPMAMAVTGLALIAGAGTLPIGILARVVVAATVVWLGVVWLNYRAYMTGLIEAVGASTLDVTQEGLGLHGKALEAHASQSLRQASDEEVPYLAGFLPQMGDLDLLPEFRELLQREAPKVKVAALNYIRERGKRADLYAVLAHLDHEAPEVREAAIRAVGIGAGDESVVLALERCLADPVAEVRAAAAAELINVGDLDGFLSGGTALKEMLRNTDPKVRLAATNALANIKTGGLIRLLAGLLEDPDRNVRLAAIHACRLRPSASLAPALISLLADGSVAGAAAEALFAIGPEALPHLGQYFDAASASLSTAKLHRVPGIVARIGDAQGLPIIAKSLESDDRDLRVAGIQAYCRLARLVGASKTEDAAVEQTLGREMKAAADQRRSLERVRRLANTEILVAALEDDFKEQLRSVLTLLGVGTPEVDMNAVHYSLTRGTRDSRSQALEILDNVLAKGAKEQVMALVEAGPAPEGPEPGTGELAELLTQADHSEWVVVAALYAAAEDGVTAAVAPARQLLTHPSAMVRETALYVVAKLDERDAVHDAAMRLRGDANPRVRTLAEGLLSAASAA